MIKDIPEQDPWDAKAKKKFIGMKVVHPAYGEENIRTIVDTYPDVPEGVILNEPLGGIRSWNLADLREVT